ncbi:MAG: single-stranded DNA-binding protein [Cypionkella sp.]
MDTEWHRIACWGGLGMTVVEHCKKGMVHDRIPYTKRTDAPGFDRYCREIIAEKVHFLIHPKVAEGESPGPAGRMWWHLEPPHAKRTSADMGDPRNSPCIVELARNDTFRMGIPPRSLGS